ncbi:N-alpha-acetyltransferase 80-like [Dreissena polymorpha]|nr:N-alpha-acetyltransferase 80-like [Dreissena polymorpha]
MTFELLPLHKNKQFSTECAEILNEEWKRSMTARFHALEKSRDEYPVNLVLIEQAGTSEAFVVGHSRLALVQGQTDKSCFLESVVIRKRLRGKGLGRILMEKTEQFAEKEGFKVIYLTTHDKEEFYAHLGYEKSQPVVSFGTDIIPEHLVKQLTGNLNTEEQLASTIKHTCADTVKNGNPPVSHGPTTPKAPCSGPIPSSVPRPPVPAPPPPPPPVVSKLQTSDISRFDPACIVWMKKRLQA